MIAAATAILLLPEAMPASLEPQAHARHTPTGVAPEGSATTGCAWTAHAIVP